MQTCEFYGLLSPDYANLFKRCNGSQVAISSLEDGGATARGYHENDLILLRAGYLKKEVDTSKTICQKHVKDFTSSFKQQISRKVCHSPVHPDDKTRSGIALKEVTYDLSRGILKCSKVKLAPGTTICVKCDFELSERVKISEISKYTPEEGSEMSSPPSQPFNLTFDSDFSPTVNKRPPEFDVVNELLRETGYTSQLKDRLIKDFDLSDPSRQRAVYSC